MEKDTEFYSTYVYFKFAEGKFYPIGGGKGKPEFEERIQKIKKFLEDSGFSVANIQGLGIRSNMDIARLPDYAPYQMARKTVLENPKTDAIYIPCSQWSPSFCVDQLEKDFGVPVVTSNLSMIWYVFSALKLRGAIKGFGKLLEGLSL